MGSSLHGSYRNVSFHGMWIFSVQLIHMLLQLACHWLGTVRINKPAFLYCYKEITEFKLQP
jgi:hypothetical protein